MSKCLGCYKEFDRVGVNLLCPECSKKGFIKADDGKLRWTLLPYRELEEVVKVLEMGAQKYQIDNWKKCDNPKRYEDALMRHMTSYMKGDKIDKESGFNHMSHIICNALFLSFFDNETKQTEEDDYLRALD